MDEITIISHFLTSKGIQDETKGQECIATHATFDEAHMGHTTCEFPMVVTALQQQGNQHFPSNDSFPPLQLPKKQLLVKF